MSEREGVWRSWVEGPRWARFPDFIKNLCFERDLDLEIEVDKRWLRETVRFKIKGSESKLRQLQADFTAAVKDYNKDD